MPSTTGSGRCDPCMVRTWGLGRILFVMDGEVASRLKDHEERADDLIRIHPDSGGGTLRNASCVRAGERAYDPVRKPYWVEHDWDSSCSPLPALVIRQAPAPIAAREPGTERNKKADRYAGDA